jgi:hypothetical protein
MKRWRRVWFPAAALILLAAVSYPQGRALLNEKDLRALNNRISGELAQETIRYLGHYSRLQPSRGYHESALWMVEAAKKAGLSDVHIEEYPSDGEIHYLMSRTAPAWDVMSAELWIVDPVEEKLTTYAEIPCSLAITSRSCDVTADLVFVGSGTSPADYEGIDVRDKVALAEGYIGAVADMAVDRFGARGVVVINQRYAHENPDIVSSIRVRTQTPTFGFGLSRRRGEELRDRVLRGEKIKVRARVETEIHPYPLENVIAVLPGTDPDAGEVVLTAHLCHYKPGANDNGSGSACILEVGRALRKLMDEGRLKKLKRTIRFLWVPENSGSLAFAATHPEITARMTAGINLDMVGQYLNDNNSTFFLHLTPHSRPHYVNDLLENLVEFVADHNVDELMSGSTWAVHSLSGSRDAFRYRIRGYTGGSDQWVYNAGLIGVPMVFFLVWPDHFYHTSGDKPEICDPTQLKRSAFLAAAAAYFLADDCPHKARRLAGEMTARAEERVAREVRRCFDMLNRSQAEDLHRAFKECRNFIEQIFLREAAALASLKGYSGRDPEVDAFLDAKIPDFLAQKAARLKQVEGFYLVSCKARGEDPREPVVTEEEKAAAGIVPVRNPGLGGPFNAAYLREKAGADVFAGLPIFRMDGRITYEVLNMIDGKRNLLQIRDAVSAEFEPVPVAWVKDFVDLLSDAGIVLD